MNSDGLSSATKVDPAMRKVGRRAKDLAKGSSAEYRAIYVPVEKHFDHKHAAEPGWKDNPRRFLLVGRPQIGKTGVFLWLAWRLWERFNTTAVEAAPEVPVNLSDLDPGTEEQEEEASNCVGEKYPRVADLQKLAFLHPPREEGGYGDPNDSGMWRHFFGRYEEGDGTPMPLPAPYARAAKPFQTRGAAAAPSATSVSKQAASTTSNVAAGSRRPAEAVPVSVVARWQSGGPGRGVRGDSFTREVVEVDLGGVPERMLSGLDEPIRKLLQNASSIVGELRLSQASLDDCWVRTSGGSLSHRLKFFDPTDDGIRTSRLCFPILTPSSGRADCALLDLSATMVDLAGERKKYVQIVAVKAKEAQQYLKRWPSHDFFVLPAWADELGVGAARFCLKRLAELICPPEFRFCLMLDDNVSFGTASLSSTTRRRYLAAPSPRTARASATSRCGRRSATCRTSISSTAVNLRSSASTGLPAPWQSALPQQLEKSVRALACLQVLHAQPLAAEGDRLRLLRLGDGGHRLQQAPRLRLLPPP